MVEMPWYRPYQSYRLPEFRVPGIADFRNLTRIPEFLQFQDSCTPGLLNDRNSVSAGDWSPGSGEAWDCRISAHAW